MVRSAIFYFPVLFFVFALYAPTHGEGNKGRDHKQTLQAERDAIESLGPDRGALDIEVKITDIQGKELDIIGIRPIGLEQDPEVLSKDLRDFNAKKIGQEIKISISGDVLFEFDKAEIRKNAERDLSKLSKAIRKSGRENIIIEGHTDSKGPHDYNMKLSKRRAEAVKHWLISKGGLQDFDFTTNGYGETKPVAPNTKPDGTDNSQGRRKNRRVEIRLR